MAVSILKCPGCGEEFEMVDNHILPSHNRPGSGIECEYSGRVGRVVDVEA